eukprot:1085133-Pelagomonas_calceolata.AAC.2
MGALLYTVEAAEPSVCSVPCAQGSAKHSLWMPMARVCRVLCVQQKAACSLIETQHAKHTSKACTHAH